MTSSGSAKVNPLVIVGALLVASVGFGLARDRGTRGPTPPACDAASDPACAAAQPSNGGAPGAPPSALTRAEACNNVGYLCADLATVERIHVRRWRDFEGTIVVHIPRPDFEDPADALALQQAASLGIRAWNGQPFPIYVDLQGDRNPHFAIRWMRTLGGTQIGIARTQWSSATGLSVVSLDLVTRLPGRESQVADVRQVRLTAAHEMGHALGLPHSDQARDVMYPTNTASALSPRDYRTMESLYALPDGTEIVR